MSLFLQKGKIHLEFNENILTAETQTLSKITFRYNLHIFYSGTLLQTERRKSNEGVALTDHMSATLF